MSSHIKFAVHAAVLLAKGAAPECPEEHHLPEVPMGGRLPEPRGPAVYGTDSRTPFNGTGTLVQGTSTAYYWSV
jgi:hypothetical protein